MNKLKSCPFCGNNIAVGVFDANELDGRDTDDCVKNPYYAVCCSMNDYGIETPNWKAGCGASGGFHAAKEEAIAAWNTRDDKEVNE